MTTPSHADHQSLSVMVGEIRGQVRELIHTANNTAAKVDQLATTAIESRSVPGDISDLKARVTVLEADRNRRDGATGVLAAILRAPSFGWLMMAAASVWALVTDRVNL